MLVRGHQVKLQIKVNLLEVVTIEEEQVKIQEVEVVFIENPLKKALQKGAKFVRKESVMTTFIEIIKESLKFYNY